MERAIRKGEAHRASDSWPNHAAVLNSDNRYMDGHRRNRSLGKRTLSWIGSGHQSLHTNGVQVMLTNLACYVVLAFCFAFSFFQGAYNHVATEMALERLLGMSLAELGEIEFHKGIGRL